MPYKTQVNSTHQLSPAKPDNDVWMTIFIHGSVTHMIRRPRINTFVNLARDTIEGTFYQRATTNIRNDPFFTRAQAMQGLGLQKIDKTSRKLGDSSAALATIFDTIDHWYHQRPAHLNRYYTYGWSALVSKKSRQKDALQFIHELSNEVKRLQAQGITPKIRIIGYSHGANVALQMAHAARADTHFIIDELILFGAPLNKGVDYLVTSPLFKKVYHLYSLGDHVQRLDLSCEGSFFSRRRFVSRKNFTVPDKVTQIRIKMVRNKTVKRSWPLANDPRYNFTNPGTLSGRLRPLQIASPGHIEMWFFDWCCNSKHPKKSPLRPLPTVSILPIVIDAVQKYKTPNCKHLVVDLRPDQSIMIVKQNKTHTVIPWLSHTQLAYLKQLIRPFALEPSTQTEYQAHIKAAVRQASH